MSASILLVPTIVNLDPPPEITIQNELEESQNHPSFIRKELDIDEEDMDIDGGATKTKRKMKYSTIWEHFKEIVLKF